MFKQRLQQFWLLCRSHKLALAAVIAALLVTLVLTLTPPLIAYEFKKWVLANGGDAVTVENVDFNPFTARLALENITIERAEQKPFYLPRLDLHAVWHTLFNREIVFNSISISGVRLEMNQSDPEKAHVGGILLSRLASEQDKDKQPAEAEKAWRFLLKSAELNDIEISYINKSLHSVLRIDHLRLAELDSQPQAKAAQFEFSGAVDKAPVSVSGALSVFSMQPSFNGKIQLEKLNIHRYAAFASDELNGLESTISIDSNIDFKVSGDGQVNLNQQGKLELAGNAWADDNIKLNSQQLQWQGKLDVTIGADSKLALTANGELHSRQLNLSQREPEMMLSNAAIDWQGNASLQQQAGHDLTVTTEARVHSEQLAVQLPQRDAAIRNEKLELNAKVELQQDAAGNLAVSVTSPSIELAATQLNSRQAGSSILQLANVRLSQLEMPSLQQVSLAVTELDGVVLGDRQSVAEADLQTDGFASFQQLRVEDLQFSVSDGVNIKQVLQQQALVVLEMGKSGNWNFQPFIDALNRLSASPDAESATDQQAPDAEASASELKVVVDRLAIGENSRLYFVDRSSDKPLVQKITFTKAQLDNIDSLKPDAAGKLLVKAILGDDASAEINGDVMVFAKQPTFDVKANIKNLSMLPYSHYMEKSLGYEIESGELNADISIAAKQGHLKAGSELVLQQLDIKPLTEVQLKRLKARLSGGLEKGLSMLKDKNDTIKLSVPVEGQLDNLKVDPSDIINQALGSALKSGAKTYFAAALFPFGTLLVIADMASDKAMQVSLDPVFFNAASSTMADKYHDYLAKVANILDDKPEIFVKVCGVSVSADKKALLEKMQRAYEQKMQQQLAEQAKTEKGTPQAEKPVKPFVAPEEQLLAQLKQLAEKRAKSVEHYLINQKKISTQRLIKCQPKLDLETPKAKPRTELSL